MKNKRNIDAIFNMIDQGDETQLVMFFENLLWSAQHYPIPETESIRKYLFQEGGCSLKDMFENK